MRSHGPSARDPQRYNRDLPVLSGALAILANASIFITLPPKTVSADAPVGQCTQACAKKISAAVHDCFCECTKTLPLQLSLHIM